MATINLTADIQYTDNLEKFKKAVEKTRQEIMNTPFDIPIKFNEGDIKNLKKELEEVRALISGTDISKVTTGAAAKSSSSKSTLSMYREQAKELLSLINSLSSSLSTLQKRSSKTFPSVLSGSGFSAEYKAMQTALENTDGLLSKISKGSTTTVKAVISELQTYYNNYLQIVGAMQDAGLKISAPDTTNLDTITQQLSEVGVQADKTKQAVQDMSGAQLSWGDLQKTSAETTGTKSIEDYIQSVKTGTAEIGTQLDALRAKMESTFDFGSIQFNTQPVFDAIESIKTKLSELDDVTIEVKGVERETSAGTAESGGTDVVNTDVGDIRGTVQEIKELQSSAQEAAQEVKEAQTSVQDIADEFKEVQAQTQKAAQGADELIKKTETYSGEMNDLTSTTRTWKNELTGVVTTLTESEDAEGEALSVEKVTKSYKTQSQAALELANVNKQAASTIDSLSAKMTALGDAGGETTEAYSQIGELIAKVKELQSGYAETGNISAFKTGMAEVAAETVSAKSAADAYIQSQKEMSRQALNTASVNKQVESTISSLRDKLNSIGTKTGLSSEELLGSADYSNLSAQVDSIVSAVKTLNAQFSETGDMTAFKTGMAEVGVEIDDTKRRITSFIQIQSNYSSAVDNSGKSISSAENFLRKYSSAQNSTNAEVRAAYNEVAQETAALGQQASSCDGSTQSVQDLSSATDNLNQKIAESTTTIEQNSSSQDKLSSTFKRLASYMTSITSIIRVIRQMVTASIELNDAMTQMQIVTQSTSEEMSSFADTAVESAQRVSASVTDIIDSATTYARLGYNTEESTMLSEYTSMLSNVGDIDTTEAQDAITSIIKAFDIDVSDIETVMDELVAVGNNYPISVAGIAEGMTNASSTLAAAGNTFEESVALLTAANTTINLCRAA